MKDTLTHALSAVIDECNHDLFEQETACADGFCPICARDEIVRLKGEAESWDKVFDRTCELLAEAKTELAKAVAAERERCALVCDEMDEAFVTIYGTDYTDFQNDPRYLQMAADAIRKGE